MQGCIVDLNNLRKKKDQRTSQGSNFHGVLAIEIMQKPQSNLERKDKLPILKTLDSSFLWQYFFSMEMNIYTINIKIQ